MPFFLKIISAPDESKVGLKYRLPDGDSLMGRASPPCEFQLEGTKVSKKHCLFRITGDALEVQDLNSANGVFVNGKRISTTKLVHKDRMVVGEFILEVAVK